MELETYIKISNRYEKRKISVPLNADKQWFKKLKLLNEEQLHIIRTDIRQNRTNSLKKKLIDIKGIIIRLDSLLQEILRENEFMICPICRSKMLKAPLGVVFTKVNGKYFFDMSKEKNIEYNYSCENCVFSTGVSVYEKQQNLLKLRRELISKGEHFLPSKFNYWHYEKQPKDL